MGEPTHNLGILYADVCNSVRLYERLGDEEAHRLIHDCLDKLVEITGQYSGTVIRTQGDGVMSVFETADQTFDAARQMQQTYRDGHITITAGFNFGTVIADGGDVYGDAVNLAARVAALARPGEILLTGETVRELSENLKDWVRLFDTTTVRGRSRPVEIFSVRSQSSDHQTTFVPTSNKNRANRARQPGLLTLQHGSRIYRIGEGTPSLVLGRDERCDLVVKSYFASRRHAVIEMSRDRFVLTDQSSNGTFVAPDNGHEIFLKRESVPLLGDGTISLGAAPSDDESYTVSFHVREPD